MEFPITHTFQRENKPNDLLNWELFNEMISVRARKAHVRNNISVDFWFDFPTGKNYILLPNRSNFPADGQSVIKGEQ